MVVEGGEKKKSNLLKMVMGCVWVLEDGGSLLWCCGDGMFRKENVFEEELLVISQQFIICFSIH